MAWWRGCATNRRCAYYFENMVCLQQIGCFSATIAEAGHQVRLSRFTLTYNNNHTDFHSQHQHSKCYKCRTVWGAVLLVDTTTSLLVLSMPNVDNKYILLFHFMLRGHHTMIPSPFLIITSRGQVYSGNYTGSSRLVCECTCSCHGRHFLGFMMF